MCACIHRACTPTCSQTILAYCSIVTVTGAIVYKLLKYQLFIILEHTLHCKKPHHIVKVLCDATVIDILYIYVCIRTYGYIPIPVSKFHASSSGLATSRRMIATINFISTSVITLIVGIVPYSIHSKNSSPFVHQNIRHLRPLELE